MSNAGTKIASLVTCLPPNPLVDACTEEDVSSLKLQNPNLLHPTGTPISLAVERIVLLILRRVQQQFASPQSLRMFEQDLRLVFVHFAEDDDVI